MYHKIKLKKMACEICGNPTAETRLGGCWECATVESIIADGTDMYEKGPDGSNIPAKTARGKLKWLIARGWKYQVTG
jgi:ribosomal protein L37AE/L43A